MQKEARLRRPIARTRPCLRTWQPLACLLLFFLALGLLADTAPAGEPLPFPNLTFYALDKSKVNLPTQLEGRTDLLLLSFASDQQNQLETWIAAAQPLQHLHPGFRAYRLPVADRENALFRWWATASIRSEETDPDTWHWIIPLFVDKPDFLAHLRIADEKSAVALLVDRTGRILWRATGGSTPESRAALTAAVDAVR